MRFLVRATTSIRATLSGFTEMPIQLLLQTAGGKICCARCVAQSKRTGVQCARPALKSSSSQKCEFHGGRSTGPRTANGRLRIAQLHTTRGHYSKQAIDRASLVSAEISSLEDIARLIGMVEGGRLRGRKSAYYVPVTTLDEAARFAARLLHPISWVSRAREQY